MSPEVAFVSTNALLVLMKIVCFVLGYLTIRLGYKLIDSGVKGNFKFSASLGGAKADLASVSPGLLFVLLGVFLIGYAIYVDKPVKFTPIGAADSAPPPMPPGGLPGSSLDDAARPSTSPGYAVGGSDEN